jgi:hypothetical protein
MMAAKHISRRRLWEPHIAFWTLSVALKLLLPSVLKWLACDTITTLMVSVWYPWGCTVISIHRERHEPSSSGPDELRHQETRQFWIDYWSLGFSVVQFVHHGVMLLPISQGSWLQSSRLSVVTSEAKLLFFVWIFAMRPMLIWYQRFLSLDKDKEDWRDFEPLSLVKRMIRPGLLDLQMAISEPVSEETWQRLVHSNVKRVLHVLVALQFLTEEWQDYLLTVMDEGRSLLLLSVFLVLPSAITQVGILYVKTLLPAARSTSAPRKEGQVLYLQYWVLNNLLSVAVGLGSWLWWWVPFATQAIFAVWCYLTFPRTIRENYATVEKELVTFGILSGESDLAVEETKTVQALRALVKRIPSASDAEGFQWLEGPLYDESGSDSESDVIRTKRGTRRRKKRMVPRSKSSPATILLDKVNVASLQDYCAEQEGAFINPAHDEGARARSMVVSEDHYRAVPESLASIGEVVEDHCLNPSTPSASMDNIVTKRLAAAMSIDSQDFGDVPLHKSVSLKEDSDRTLPPSMSLVEDSDESSRVSTYAVCDVHQSSQSSDEFETSIHEEHSRTREAPRTAEGYRIPILTTYNRPHMSLLKPSTADRKDLCLGSLVKSTASTLSSTPPIPAKGHSWDSGLYLSEVDTTASSIIEGAESFESYVANYYEESRRAGRKLVTAANTAALAQQHETPIRRSARLRKLHDKHSHQTQSLLDLQTPTAAQGNGNVRRLQQVGTSDIRNHRHTLPLPEYVRVDASGQYAGSPERRSKHGKR